MILYRELIARALRLAWQHKFLWGLAFFAALGGNGGEYELLFSGSDSISSRVHSLRLVLSYGIHKKLTAYGIKGLKRQLPGE